MHCRISSARHLHCFTSSAHKAVFTLRRDLCSDEYSCNVLPLSGFVHLGWYEPPLGSEEAKCVSREYLWINLPLLSSELLQLGFCWSLAWPGIIES